MTCPKFCLLVFWVAASANSQSVGGSGVTTFGYARLDTLALRLQW